MLLFDSLIFLLCMNHRYAILVYVVIMGNLYLGYLVLPFFPVLSPINRHHTHLAHQSFLQPHSQVHHILKCSTVITDEAHEVSNDQQLADELMQVFGHDTLWQRAQQTQPPKKLGKNTKHNAHKIIPTPNPLSASWSTISNLLPFHNDLDLGSNSDTDIYVQFLAKKNWILHSGLRLNTTQIFRYGSSSKNYAETYLDLTQKFQQQAQISTQFNFSKTQDSEYVWSNRTFQKLNLLSQNNLTYGILSTGDYENKALRVNEWGPYFSWKRPIWRNWVFMQNDINYVNMPTSEQGYSFNYQMKFEAQF